MLHLSIRKPAPLVGIPFQSIWTSSHRSCWAIPWQAIFLIVTDAHLKWIEVFIVNSRNYTKFKLPSSFSDTVLLHKPATTGLSPRHLLMGRRDWGHAHLDLMHPDNARTVQKKQQGRGGGRLSWTFTVNDKLYMHAKNFHECDKWIPAIVKKVTGPLSCIHVRCNHTGCVTCRLPQSALPGCWGALEEPNDWVYWCKFPIPGMDTTATGPELMGFRARVCLDGTWSCRSVDNNCS